MPQIYTTHHNVEAGGFETSTDHLVSPGEAWLAHSRLVAGGDLTVPLSTLLNLKYWGSFRLDEHKSRDEQHRCCTHARGLLWEELREADGRVCMGAEDRMAVMREEQEEVDEQRHEEIRELVKLLRKLVAGESTGTDETGNGSESEGNGQVIVTSADTEVVLAELEMLVSQVKQAVDDYENVDVSSDEAERRSIEGNDKCDHWEGAATGQ